MADSKSVLTEMKKEEPPRNLSEEQFILEVQRRPVIWNSCDVVDKHKVGSAWREICRLTWPEFDRWSPDVKCSRCLQLQRDWKALKNSFTKEYNSTQKNTGQQSTLFKNFDFLKFLIPAITTNKSIIINKKAEFTGKDQHLPAKQEEHSPPKRARTDPSPERSNRNHENDEDEKFLLSLLPFIQDVPKASKLALRSDMLQLIAKYTPSSSSKSYSIYRSKNLF